MGLTLANSVAYLRTSRQFPEEIKQLCLEINKSYVDVANAVNSRTIGLFPINVPAITGDQWFSLNSSSTGQRNQTLRQVYQFTSAAPINHGILINEISGFTRIYGTFTDGTNWYPLPYVDVADATNQINIYVSPTQIVISAGAGSPPSITSGYVVLEWLSNV